MDVLGASNGQDRQITVTASGFQKDRDLSFDLAARDGKRWQELGGDIDCNGAILRTLARKQKITQIF